jgi:hypothetical protein
MRKNIAIFSVVMINLFVYGETITKGIFTDASKAQCLYSKNTEVAQGTYLKNDNIKKPIWPDDITADIGYLQVRLESRSFWTLYRVYYKGEHLGLDVWGSHYGNVAKFHGIGFIGSGHTENENEKVISKKLLIDGKNILNPEKKYKCSKSIKLIKKSQIRNLEIDSELEIFSDRFIEDVRIKALKPEKLDFMLLFMHPWNISFSDYAILDKGQEATGKFTDSKAYKVNKAVRGVSLFNSKLNKAIITIINEIPQGVQWRNSYWDYPKRYRKHYLKTFNNKTIKPGKDYYFRAETILFETTFDQWKKKAQEIYNSKKLP